MNRLRHLTVWGLIVAMVLTGVTAVRAPEAHAVVDAVVTGTVIDATTKQGLSGVSISDPSSGRTAVTGVGGTYSLSLPTGDHTITASLAKYVPASSPALTLGSAQIHTQGFTLEKYATVSGIVTETGSNVGIPAVVVKFFAVDQGGPNPDATATSGPDGSWSTDLPPASYLVSFTSSDQKYESIWHGGATRNTAEAVSLVAGATLDITASMSPAPPPTEASTSARVSTQGVAGITGRVTVDPGSVLVGTARITVYGSDGNEAATTMADADGYFAVHGLAAGYYLVGAEISASDGHRVRFVGGAFSRAAATYITLSEGATLAAQDIHFDASVTLSGSVRHRGVAQPGVQVFLTGMGTWAGASTVADGTFRITGIQPGTYRLSATYLGKVVWWNGASEMGAATPIVVTPGGTLSGYTLDVPPWYQITGTVRTTDGTRVASAAVWWSDGVERHSVIANGLGDYTIVVGPGTYELGLGDASKLGVLWSPGSLSPDLISLSSDTVKDLTMPDLRTITTTIRGTDGSVPATATIGILNSRHESYDGVGVTNGNVDLTLPPGDFSLVVRSGGYLDLKGQLEVTASTSLSLTLSVGGRIAGTVSGAQAVVTAINVATGEKVELRTPAGPYVLEGLATGDYVVTVSPVDDFRQACGWASWHGGITYATAQRIHVEAGSVVEGVDTTVNCQPDWLPGGELLVTVRLPASAPSGAADGVRVWAVDALGGLWFGLPENGEYRFRGMPTGNYVVTATQSDLGLASKAWLVVVQAGQTATLGFSLGNNRHVSGRVVGPMGEPVRTAVTDGDTAASTGPSGDFTLALVWPGPHTLSVDAPRPYASTTVDVTVDSTDVEDVVIHLSLAGSLAGWVPERAPVEVTLMDATGRVLDSETFIGPYFAFYGLPPGLTYARFSSTAYVTEWWKDASDLASATPIDVPAGGAVHDIVPDLAPATAGESTTVIRGVVRSSRGPVPGVHIETTSDWDTTAADGSYSLSVPRGDTYRIEARICLGPSVIGCTGQDFLDTRVVDAQGAEVTGVDFSIPDGKAPFTSTAAPTISGSPLLGATLTASVAAWTPVPDRLQWAWWSDGEPIANQNGTTLVLTAQQVGHKITVSVIGSKEGYVTPVTYSVPTSAVEVPGAIHALRPSRVLDTRVGQGFTGPVRDGTIITLPVVGQGGVPQGASAVLVNLTVTEPTAGGFISAYGSGGPVPSVSNANFVVGATSANLALVPVGSDGAIALKASVAGSVQVVADVQGYVVGGPVTAEGALVPVAPTRLLDTRTTQRVAAQASVAVQVAGVAGVPADGAAAVVNLTVTGPGAGGFVTAYPTGVARPTASNVNFVTGQTVPNLAVVKVGADHTITIFNAASSPIDVVVDIQGYVTAGTAALPGTVKPVTPTRAVDTRISVGTTGPVLANTERTVGLAGATGLSAPPQGALINLTVTDTRASGWLAAYPPGSDRPLVSNLNFTAGATVPNLALATLQDGNVVLFNGSGSSVQMVADVLAYVLS